MGESTIAPGRRQPRKLSGAEGRPLRGYAPLVGIVVVGLLAVSSFPSRTPREIRTAMADSGGAGLPATGWEQTVGSCQGGGPQVAGDPYSPPCFTFDGDNGGATSKGVTAEEIRVSYRLTPEAHPLTLLATLMGIEFTETPDDFRRTVEGLLDHFNQTFQFYGRRLVLQPFEGKGTLTDELLGGGQAEAFNDGIRAGVEIEAFADVSALTQPYAEGLVRQQTVAFGAPYLSREWFTDRRPYAWSLSTDCSVVAETASAYALTRLVGQPAVHAGGELRGQTRKLAVIAPSNPEYQQCTAAGLRILEEGGARPDFVADYVLDLARIPNQAASISAQLVDAGVTTISCYCDPFMILNLTEQMADQGIEPEWFVSGTGFSDLDLIGQGLQSRTDQWVRSFGISPLGLQVVAQESPGYRAFKSVRPDEEPSSAVDLLYHHLYQLAIGVHMAGPDLTPATLEAGLHSYPESTGPSGTWDYGPGRHTPVVDFREVWWDPELDSPFNGLPGSYRSTGQRFVPGDLTPGQPPRPPLPGP